MFMVNVAEAKARLSEYLDRAARGERVVICRHNKPVAELRAAQAVRTQPRPIGPLPGRPTFEVPPSFFDPLSAEDLDAWEGGSPADPLSPGWKPPPPADASEVGEPRSRDATRRRRRARRRSRSGRR